MVLVLAINVCAGREWCLVVVVLVINMVVLVESGVQWFWCL